MMIHNNQPFRVRPYSKRELAMMYFPYTENPDSAVAHLRCWMKRNGEVLRQLRAIGYKPYDKIFTAKQVAIIVETFGEP